MVLRGELLLDDVLPVGGVLSGLFYQRYLHKCDPSPEVGPELRRLVEGWMSRASHHAAEMGKHAEGASLYYEHRAYGLTYESCARSLRALVEWAEAGAVTAQAVGSEQSLREPVRRVGVAAEGRRHPPPPPHPGPDQPPPWGTGPSPS